MKNARATTNAALLAVLICNVVLTTTASAEAFERHFPRIIISDLVHWLSLIGLLAVGLILGIAHVRGRRQSSSEASLEQAPEDPAAVDEEPGAVADDPASRCTEEEGSELAAPEDRGEPAAEPVTPDDEPGSLAEEEHDLVAEEPVPRSPARRCSTRGTADMAELLDKLPLAFYQVDLRGDERRIIFASSYLSTILDYDGDLVGKPHATLARLLSVSKDQLSLFELSAKAGSGTVIDVPVQLDRCPRCGSSSPDAGGSVACRACGSEYQVSREPRVFEIFVVGGVVDGTAVIMVRDVTGSAEHLFRNSIMPIVNQALASVTRIEANYEEILTFFTLMMSIWQVIKPRRDGVLKGKLTSGWTQKELIPVIRRVGSEMTLRCSHDHDDEGIRSRKYSTEEKDEARRLLQVTEPEATQRYKQCFHELLLTIKREGEKLRTLLEEYNLSLQQRDESRRSRGPFLTNLSTLLA